MKKIKFGLFDKKRGRGKPAPIIHWEVLSIENEELFSLINEVLNPPAHDTKEILQAAREITPSVPVWEKYLLTVNEAVAYFGIGESKLRDFISTHKDAAFLVWNGSKALLKRKMFEEYIDTSLCAL